MPLLTSDLNIANISCGLDALQAGQSPAIRDLKGRKIGLLTNHTGCTKDNKTTREVLHDFALTVSALFSPEHGVSGTREGAIESGQAEHGMPLYSLYGESRRPSCKMLANLSAFVCDIQDVGARFYTYATTLAYCMEECAARNIPVIVLDRPNPLGGETIEGPALDEAHRSFVGYLRMPIRHGLTLGELARWHKLDAGLDLDLQIVPVSGWQRQLTWDRTNLRWPVPSPNLPDYESAAWYPGACLLEFSGVSVGRGTEAPFQIVGAPWLDPARIIAAMESWPQSLRQEISAEPITFTPTRATFEGESCQGIYFKTATGNRSTPARPVALGMALLSTLHRVHPVEFDGAKLQAALPLLGSAGVLRLLQEGDIQAAIDIADSDAAAFRQARQPILMY